MLTGAFRPAGNKRVPRRKPSLLVRLYSIDRRHAEGLTRAGVQRERRAGIGNVVSPHRRVPLVTIGGVEREHRVLCHAVFPGRIDEDGCAWLGVSAKSFAGSVDADILYIHAPGKCRRNVEAHAQNASVGHPEKCLRVERNRGGESPGAKAVAGAAAQLIILPRGQCFLHRNRGRGNPAALAK
jgi:hypothetical protein